MYFMFSMGIYQIDINLMLSYDCVTVFTTYKICVPCVPCICGRTSRGDGQELFAIAWRRAQEGGGLGIGIFAVVSVDADTEGRRGGGGGGD